MRRDLVVQVIVQYDDFWENFATPFEAESFINSNLDELDLPVMVRLEDMKGNVKWYYDLVEDERPRRPRHPQTQMSWLLPSRSSQGTFHYASSQPRI